MDDIRAGSFKFAGREACEACHSEGVRKVIPAVALVVLPLIILYVLVKLLPPWHKREAAA
jgi:hypothetical protein